MINLNTTWVRYDMVVFIAEHSHVWVPVTSCKFLGNKYIGDCVSYDQGDVAYLPENSNHSCS